MPRKTVFERLEELLRVGPGKWLGTPEPPATDPVVIEEARKALLKLGMKPEALDRKLTAALASAQFADSGALITEIFRRND